MNYCWRHVIFIGSIFFIDLILKLFVFSVRCTIFFIFSFRFFLLHHSLGPSDDIHNSLFSWCCIPDRFLKLIWYRSILMMGEPGFIKGHASGHRKRLSLGSIWEIWKQRNQWKDSSSYTMKIQIPKSTKITGPKIPLVRWTRPVGLKLRLLWDFLACLLELG